MKKIGWFEEIIILSEEIGKKVKNKQKYITTNEDLSAYGYRRYGIRNKTQRWYNKEHSKAVGIKRYYKNHDLTKQKKREYYAEHKEEIRKQQKQQYKKHKEKRLTHWKQKYYADVEKSRAHTRDYRAEHNERINQLQRDTYWEDHEETLRKSRDYRNNHKEELVAQRKKYYEENREKILVDTFKYYQTDRGKESQRRTHAKRKRDLGYHEIAKFELNSIMTKTIYHHLDNTNVIELPEWIHRSCGGSSREIHRERVMEKLKYFLTSEYYDVLDQDIFDRYQNGEY